MIDSSCQPANAVNNGRMTACFSSEARKSIHQVRSTLIFYNENCCRRNLGCVLLLLLSLPLDTVWHNSLFEIIFVDACCRLSPRSRRSSTVRVDEKVNSLFVIMSEVLCECKMAHFAYALLALK